MVDRAARDAALRAPARRRPGALISAAPSSQRARRPVASKASRSRPRAATTERIDCDLLAMSGGWNPTIHLTCHLGGKPVWDEALAAFVPGTLPPGHERRRRGGGSFGLAACLADGARPAPRPPRLAASAAPQRRARRRRGRAAYARAPLWQVAGGRGKAFVDFQNDVTVKDIELAEREGFRSVEHLKRYTTLGMATDQGKTANVNGLGHAGRTVTGRYDRRGRHHDVPAALHAGRDRRVRRPSSRQGFPPGAARRRRTTGRTSRAPCSSRPGLGCARNIIPRAGEKRLAATRQPRGDARARARSASATSRPWARSTCRAATPASSSTASISTPSPRSPVGKARYGADAARGRLRAWTTAPPRASADDHYFMTTTTANAAKVMQHLEFCQQVLWPELDVADGLGHRAMGAVRRRRSARARRAAARGRSRRTTSANDAFPYLGVRRGDRAAAASRRGCSASPSPASWPTRSPCRRATARRWSAP